MTRNSYIHLFDELRLWGAYPKALYFSNNIQLGKTMLYDSMSMNTYLPGMPIFQYFCTKILGEFRENFLYFSYCLLGASLFLPILRKIEWKKFYLILPYMIFIIFAPMVFYNNGFDEGFYYKSLFIDSLLGIAIAYSFYLLCNNPFKNIYNLLNFTLSLSLMFLLKENGIIFVMVSFFFSIILDLFYYKNRKYIRIISLFAFIILLFFSWKITLNIYKKNSDVTNAFTYNNIINYIVKPTEEQKEITEKMLNASNKYPVIISNFSIITQKLTYKNVLIFFSTMLILLIIISKRKDRIKYFFYSMSIIGQAILYWIALLLLYSLKYNDVLCFQRYNNTSLLAVFISFCFIITEEAFNNYKARNMLIIFICVMLFIPFRAIGTTYPQIYNYNQEKVISEYYESLNIEKDILSKIKKDNKITNIYFASNEEYPIMHHRLHFAFLDDNIAIKNLFGSILDFGDMEQFKNMLYDNKYKYVYVYNCDEEMQNFYNLKDDDSLKEKTLYEVKKNSDKILLKEVIN